MTEKIVGKAVTARELADTLIEQLESMPNREETIVPDVGQAFSVAELIADLRQLTPRGLEYLELYRRALENVAEINRKRAK